MNSVTAEEKAVYAAFKQYLGFRAAAVVRCVDEDQSHHVHVASCVDSPSQGLYAYATLGLSSATIAMEGQVLPIRTEFLAAVHGPNAGLREALATAAFCVIKSSWFVAPGVIFYDVLKMHELSETMSHFFFTTPFLWPRRFPELAIMGYPVRPLLAVPISEPEAAYVEQEGPYALDDHLTTVGVDVCDLNRPSSL